MRVHRDLNSLPHFRNAAITIGSFDGVHAGHYKIIKKLRDLAVSSGGESVVITFHPHPRQIVYPKDDSLKLITTTEEKVALFENSGIDHLVIVPFTFEFSQLSADEYILKFLVGKFHPKHIVIGYDHRFGMNRRGDINYLKWHEQSGNYTVVEIEKKEISEIAVSSTKIREYLDRGEVQNAAKLMNHYFTLTGKVIKGQQIGQKLGFPTANIQVSERHKLIPPDGIYAAYAVYDGERHRAMLYIGNRPTLKKANNKTIEVNIFDFNKTIYEDEIQVELVDFIRKDEKLDDLEALRDQIARDQAVIENRLNESAQLLRVWENSLKPSVAIVILNYNGRKYLEQYLPSVMKTAYPNTQVYVADNASRDGSVEFVKQHFPRVSIIKLNQNYGFAKGYNLALHELEPDYFVLLNSDVEVPQGWLQPLVDLMDSDHTIAAVQPKIRAFGQPEYFEYAGAAGGWLDFLGYPFCRGRIFDTVEKDIGQYDQVSEVFWASGACMLIRAPLFKVFEGFDEEFFAHQEEIDLCWRMKRAGYKIMFNPKSVVYHLGGGTLAYQSPYKTYLNFRNSYYLMLKNEKVLKMAYLMPIRLCMDTAAALSFLVRGRWLHFQAVIGAFFSLFLALVTFIKKRLDIDTLVEQVRISPQPNRIGVLQKSIVLQYFLFKKKHFKDL